ncbi:MAG: pilus assembly protein PilM [Bacilli bacterium]|nr:pilus assembly protein PilM [Bacilli bacterium]
MKSRITVIELSNRFVKVMIGSVDKNQVIVHYVKKIPTRHVLENGSIVDRENLLATLAKINPINDEQYNIHELIDDAVIILPPYGLEIYGTTQITSVISKERVIGNQDIINIYSIISNKKLPVDNDLIDTIPEIYRIDSGERYAVAPIGKISRAISVQAKVHTLPKRINAEYSGVISSAGINISHKVVSTFAISELFATYVDLPSDYFLIDIGAYSTSVSLISGSKLLASRSFAWGGDNITERIIECFNINEKEAEHLKELYGLDTRKMNFLYPITTSPDGEKKRYAEDLNQIISESLDKFVGLANVSIEQLAVAYKVDTFRNLPFILTGGGSKLHGLLGYLKNKLNKEDIRIVAPRTIGARDPSLCACLGAILVHKNHPGVVEDINTATTTVSRED